MNATLIKQLANGEIAVVNDGTLEELRQVLKKAFPEDCDSTLTSGLFMYYFKSSTIYWYCENHTTLPTASIKQFFKHE